MSKTTTFETFLHLLNGYVGSGILANPKAFRYDQDHYLVPNIIFSLLSSDGGLVVSSILTPIIGLLANYCIHMMVSVNEFVCSRLDLPVQDYQQV